MKNESGKDKSNYKTPSLYFSKSIWQLLFLFLKRQRIKLNYELFSASFAFFVFSIVTNRKRVQVIGTPNTEHRQMKRRRVQS